MLGADCEMEASPLGGPISCNGQMLTVHIYKCAKTAHIWILEVVSETGSILVWEQLFIDEMDAFEAFNCAVADNSLPLLFKNMKNPKDTQFDNSNRSNTIYANDG